MTTPESMPLQKPAPRVIAVIDIGATAVRMEIAEVTSDGDIHIIESMQQAVHLGKDTFTRHTIQQATIEECVKILRGFRRVMEEYGITEPKQIRAVATSSVREAGNRDTFLDRIYIATSIAVDLIEEAEETRLTYLGVQDLLARDESLSQGDVLVVEVGGGDTELLLVQDGYVSYSNTYRLGTLRMRETLETRYATSEQMSATFLRHIELMVDQIKRSVPTQRRPILVAVSGDARFAAEHLSKTWRSSYMVRLEVGDFTKLARKVSQYSVDELVKKYRLSYQEAETLGPALLGYAELAKVFDIEKLLIPKSSLRHGLLREAVIGSGWSPLFADQVIHSAIALGHKYAFDERHGRQVADLCLKFFHELRSEHQLGPRYEMLLHIAALIHEVGLFINNRSHHKHSMYIILNSDLFGLNHHDMQLIALIARYHRKAPPLPHHEVYNTLDREERMIVSKLSAILRVADALDRNHMQQVREVSFVRRAGTLQVFIHDVEDLTLERIALKEKGSMFNDVYGMRMILETGTPNEGMISDV